MRVKRNSRKWNAVLISNPGNRLPTPVRWQMGPTLPLTAGRKPVASVKLGQGAFLRPASHQPVAVAFSPPHCDGGRRPGWCGGSVAWERSDGFAPARNDRRADPGVNAPGILRRGPIKPIFRFHRRICICFCRCCCFAVGGASGRPLEDATRHNRPTKGVYTCWSVDQPDLSRRQNPHGALGNRLQLGKERRDEIEN
jgi:hypothetical protein